jgi:hypothetical protein
MHATKTALLLPLGLICATPALANDNALAHVAADAHIPVSQLRVEHETTVVLASGLLHRAKVRDQTSGRLYYVDYDASGVVADGDTRVRAALRARVNVEGKLNQDVAARIRASAPSEPIKIALWLRGTPPEYDWAPSSLAAESPLAIREEREFLLADLRQFAQKTQAAILPRISELGGKLLHSSTLAPLVFVSMPAGNVVQLSESPAIDQIYSAWNRGHDLLNVQTCAVGVKPDVWDAGYTGAGIIVAHCEDSRADRDNTCLACDAGANKPWESNIDQHSTACTGMMVSNDPTYRGVAYGACFYSANGGSYSDDDMSGAIDSGAANADVTSGSWGFDNGGSLQVHDRHTDYVVRNTRHFVDDAAGNSGNSGFVSTPGSAFNSVTVACSYDYNTCDVGNDRISSFSSGRDPYSAHNDRELPEITAPGEDIYSLTTSGSPSCPKTNVGSGTSYSAPIISGIAAQAMDATPDLNVWPEPTKALLLAGGLNNLEGAARLSNLDGVGQVDAKAVLTSAVAHRWAAGLLTLDRFSGGQLEVAMGHANAGQRMKAALCWDSNPNGSYTTDPLDADLDLAVIDPSGAVVASSNSYDNPYEVVDFTVATSGVYRARITYRNWNGASEYVAGAWSLTAP